MEFRNHKKGTTVSGKPGDVNALVFRLHHNTAFRLLLMVFVIPSGYYEDTNGRWHRPDGQFACNAEMSISASNLKTSDGTHNNSLFSTETN